MNEFLTLQLICIGVAWAAVMTLRAPWPGQPWWRNALIGSAVGAPPTLVLPYLLSRR